MAVTRCPNPACRKPAVLEDSRRIGSTYVPELGMWVDVIERHIVCPAPGGCGTDGYVHVSHRIELYRGETAKRAVSRVRSRVVRRRSCGRDEETVVPLPRNCGAKS